jgi:signal transduction histidine kinase
MLELTGLDLELSAAPISEPVAGEAATVVAIHDVSHLKALDRIKTRFVSNVSHELRTPATTIKLYADLMQRHPERWEEYATVLAQEANRQARLVEDILEISRIDAGRMEMNPRPTSLDELANIAIVNYRTLAQERGVTLERRPMNPSEARPVALVDPERMMQVLNNLVANAIYYTPEGGKVTISTSQERAERRTWATMTVEDTGMGIPEEELSHVFERFFRGEQPQLMQLPGTGLGLAIVKEIIELHGGRVTLESQIGEGTAFTVWLPLAD